MTPDWTIRRYGPEDMALWDSLAGLSRQGTLLHLRGYMDYHADRFVDCSLIALRKGIPTALLPANIVGDALYSHQGLTYGAGSPRAAISTGATCSRSSKLGRDGVATTA